MNFDNLRLEARVALDHSEAVAQNAAAAGRNESEQLKAECIERTAAYNRVMSEEYDAQMGTNQYKGE